MAYSDSILIEFNSDCHQNCSIPFCLDFSVFHFRKRFRRPASELPQHFPTRKTCLRLSVIQPRKLCMRNSFSRARAAGVLGKHASAHRAIQTRKHARQNRSIQIASPSFDSFLLRTGQAHPSYTSTGVSADAAQSQPSVPTNSQPNATPGAQLF